MGGVRAGPIRTTAILGGLSFEDEFYSYTKHGTEKAQGKRRWSGLPEIAIYDSNGNVIGSMGQSNSLLRYVGTLTGLYPKSNAIDCLLMDELMDSVEDLANMWVPAYLKKDKEERKQTQDELMKADKLPYWFQKFNLRLIENEKRGNKNGFAVGDALSVADLKLYYGLTIFRGKTFEFMDTAKLWNDNKELDAFCKRIEGMEKIKEFDTVTFPGIVAKNKEEGKDVFKHVHQE